MKHLIYLFSIASLVLLVAGLITTPASAACGTCNWYGTNYPVCCNQNTGWGWENSQSCIGCQDCVNASQSCSSCSNCSGGSSTSTTSGSSTSTTGGSSTSTTTTAAGTTTTAAGGTCTWCGSGSYPQCAVAVSGCWGWENNQSCLTNGCSSGGCTAVCGGGSSTSTTTTSGSSTSTTSGSTTSTTSGSSGSCPSSVSCPTSSSCGCYTVSGLGSNKTALRNAGGSQYMVASAMMETELMNTNYSTCDGKSGDSCCCGVTKANFYAARMASCSNTGSGYSSWCSGMNSSRSTDVSCWNQIRSYWGSRYWAVHRNGESGATSGDTADIRGFKAVNDWTNNQIGSHLSDDVRFWSNVQAI